MSTYNICLWRNKKNINNFWLKKKKGLIKILAIEVFKIVGHLLYMYFPFQISVPQPHACMVHSAYPYLMTISASAQQDTEGRTVS